MECTCDFPIQENLCPICWWEVNEICEDDLFQYWHDDRPLYEQELEWE